MKSNQMKAIFWTGNDNFALGYAPIPTPGHNQVLIKIEASSICTTDFHYADFECIPPITPGHEIAGTIINTGSGTPKSCIGTRVALDPVQYCTECELCKKGLTHLCLNVRHLGNSKNPGGWAEYIVIDLRNTYKIPADLSSHHACLAEPAAVCLESFKRGSFAKGDTALILGDGTFGFIHAMIAKALGAETIIVAGHHDERLRKIQQKTGCIICNTHHHDLDNVIKKNLNRCGFDIAIEATGSSQVASCGLKNLRPRGSMVLFSYIWKPDILNPALIHMNELNILGACRSLNCYDDVLKMLADKSIDADMIIDIKTPMDNFDDAIRSLQAKRNSVFKAIICMEQE